MVYGKCDVGPCELIPGLVYDSETKQCSWPDEVGCSLDGKLKLIKQLPNLTVINGWR